jgi:hypothetical protein
MAEQTDKYYKVAGWIILGVSFGYLISKVSQGRRDKQVMNRLTAKAELDRIVNTPKDMNTESINVVDEERKASKLRTSAFSETAQPSPTVKMAEVEMSQKQPQPQSFELPANALLGKNDSQGFDDGDVIYSLGNSNAKIARVVSGNYTFQNKSGESLGEFQAKHAQKLGIVTSKEVNGVFFKAAPDWKKYGFVEYQKIYKLR